MGKIFAILLMVAGLWVGLEVYNEGVDGAFGGALDFDAQVERDARAATETLSTPKRVGAVVERSMKEAEKRYQDLD